MFDLLILGVLVCLIGASYLDLKYRAIPSVFLTGLLFIVAVVRIDFIHFGILAGIFAWVMKDILSIKELEFGMADIKIMMIIGLILNTRFEFFLLIGIFAVFQFIYTAVWMWKMGDDKERPFVPCLLAVYVTMMLIRGFA